jgi:hypothetical protein
MKALFWKVSLVTFTTLVIACGNSKKSQSTTTSTSDSSSVSKTASPTARGGNAPAFRHIPADTPFVFASLDTRSGFVSMMARFLTPIIDVVISEELKSANPSQKRVLLSLKKLMNHDALTTIGLSTSPHFAMYMVDATLVLRVDLNDGDKLRTFVVDLAKEHGDSIPFAERNGWHYIEAPKDEHHFVAAIGAKELIIAAAPRDKSQPMLGQLLDGVMPQKSVADTPLLDDLHGRYGGHTIGYLDSEKVFERLWDSESQSNPICKKELQRMISWVPRVVWSMQENTRNHFAFHMAFEMRPDVNKSLSSVFVSVPAYSLLQTETDSMIMGLGLNTQGLTNWLREAGRTLDDAPFQCSDLTAINDLSRQTVLLNMLPPIWTDLSGFVLSLEDVDPEDPASLKGIATVATRNPQALLSLITQTLPGVSAPKINTDGRPVEFDGDALGLEGSLSLAMGPGALGIAIGQRTDFLSELVLSPPETSAPFLTITYDYSRWRHLVDEEEEIDKDVEPELRGVLRNTLNMLGVVAFEMQMTPHGIHTISRMQLR